MIRPRTELLSGPRALLPRSLPAQRPLLAEQPLAPAVLHGPRVVLVRVEVAQREGAHVGEHGAQEATRAQQAVQAAAVRAPVKALRVLRH